MKVFQIIGYKNTGKTTLLTKILNNLSNDNNKIAVMKNTHNTDVQDKNSDSEIIYRNNASEVLLQTPEDIYTKKPHVKFINILRKYKKKNYDYFIIEGLKEKKLPRIVCNTEKNRMEKVYLINLISKCDFNPDTDNFNFDNYSSLTEVIKIIKNLPDFPAGLNCMKCNKTCIELYSDKYKGKKAECVVEKKGNVEIIINDKNIPLQPFVKNLVKNTVMGLLKNLKGYEKGKIEINIDNRK